MLGCLYFCSDCFVMYENSLMRKQSLIPNFMKSQTGQELITIPILHNILRSKGKEVNTMKFGHLIVFSKIAQKIGWETSSRSIFDFQ